MTPPMPTGTPTTNPRCLDLVSGCGFGEACRDWLGIVEMDIVVEVELRPVLDLSLTTDVGENTYHLLACVG